MLSISTWARLAAAAAFFLLPLSAAPFHYEIDIPAVETGNLLVPALHFHWDSPSLLTGVTNLQTQAGFGYTGGPTTAIPLFFFFQDDTDINTTWNSFGSGITLTGSTEPVPGVHFNAPGSYYGDWQWIALNGTSRTYAVLIGATLTITDVARNIEIDNPVPEPSTFAMLMLGAVALACLRRR